MHTMLHFLFSLLTYTDGVQVLPEGQLCFLAGQEQLPMAAVGGQGCRDCKKSTVSLSAPRTRRTSHQERSREVSQTWKILTAI